MSEIFRDLRAEPSFRDRFPRPSFMTVTVALALVVTPGVGVLAAELRDPAAESARFAREADLALRGDLLAQGLAPLPARGESAVSALAALGVEVKKTRRRHWRCACARRHSLQLCFTTTKSCARNPAP